MRVSPGTLRQGRARGKPRREGRAAGRVSAAERLGRDALPRVSGGARMDYPFRMGRATPSSEFIAAVRAILASRAADVDPEFFHYFRELDSEAGGRRFVRHVDHLVSLMGGVAGRVVADVGSGFGLVSNLIGLRGARAVVAVEPFLPRLESHRRLLDTTFRALTRVWPVRGLARALPLGDGSVDVVLSNEAASHYHDLDAFLDEAARVLAPGGVLVVADGNNGANPRIRAFTEELWERCENGPCGRIGGHELTTCFRERRERLLAGRFPDLPPERVAALARATSGFVHPCLEEAVAAHLAGGPAPASPYHRGTLPVEPLHGEVMERLIDPRELAVALERRGFEARAIPHYGGARGGMVALANEVLCRLPTFRFARGFRLVARRRR